MVSSFDDAITHSCHVLRIFGSGGANNSFTRVTMPPIGCRTLPEPVQSLIPLKLFYDLRGRCGVINIGSLAREGE